MSMFGDLFGGCAAREMRRTVSESRAERVDRVHERALHRQAGREQPTRTAAGVKRAAIFSLVAPFLAVGGAFLIVRFVPDRRTASALGLFCPLLVFAGLIAGWWALLSAISYRVRAGRGVAIAGTCICGLLVIFLVFRALARRAAWQAGPPPPPSKQTP